MPHDPVSIALILLSITLVGLAKGGLAGLGMLGMPLMAMAFPPVEAAAVLLPLLIVQDMFGIWLYRRSWNGAILAWMLPSAIAGIAAAAMFAASMPASAILALLGLISVAFGLWRLWVAWRGIDSGPLAQGEWPGLVFGFFSGFTSQIAHAGAPPFQMWVIPKNLPHLQYVGTAAIFFAMMNWVKVPAFLALGAFSRESLTISAVLSPVAIIATLIGAKLVRHLRGPLFYAFANVMLALVGMKLIWDAIV